jgi:hypothetical protein
MLGLCLLTAPVLPAFAQDTQGQNGNNQGQNGNNQGQNGNNQGQNGNNQGRTAVPEPSTTLLLVLGLGGVGAFEWRRRVRGAAKRQSS